MVYRETTVLMRGWTAVCILAALLLAAFPFVYQRFPTYAPGYLIQIAALAIGYSYFRHAKLFVLYTDWRARALLILSFVIPLQNTFWLKAFRKAFLSSHLILEVFRPEIMLLLAVFVAAIIRPSYPDRKFPLVLKLSFVAGSIGLVLCTAASPAPSLTMAVGVFEFCIPFAVMYTFMALAPDRRFFQHSITLLVIASALVSSALIASALVQLQGATAVPVTAHDFRFLRRLANYETIVGGNAYENLDFYNSLWVLLVPAILLAYYQTRHRITALIVLAILLYAGFLEYSRSGVIVVTLGAISGLMVLRVVGRQWSWLATIVLVLIAIMHIDSQSRTFIVNGISQFGYRLESEVSSEVVPGPEEERTKVSHASEDNLSHASEETGSKVRDVSEHRWTKVLDISGDERAVSWKKGVEVGVANFWTGIGYGTYRASVDPTPPHSSLIYRFAEGGIFGALSIFLLALYAPVRLLSALRNREKDLLLYACLIGAGCFMIKGLIFSASFSLVGIVVWGFAFAALTSFTFVPFGGGDESCSRKSTRGAK